MISSISNTIHIENILDQHPSWVVFALDKEYRYILYNKLHSETIKNIWGSDISLNQCMLDIITSDADKTKARKNFDKCLSGEIFSLIEDYGDTKLERKHYKDTYFPLRDSENQIYGLCVIVEDITKAENSRDRVEDVIRKLENQINERTLELEQINSNLVEENAKRLQSEQELSNIKNQIEKALANEMELNKLKTQFISMVSHEFRTPLTIIQAATFLLEKSFERNDREKFDKNIEKVYKSVETMTSLMESVLNIGKLEQGKIKPTNKVFNIKEEVEQIITSNKNYVRIVKASLPNEAVYIDSDKTLCTQIVNNLLSNATKYSSPNPNIKLAMIADNRNVEITIEDNGIGMEQNSIEEMLEPFKRDDKISGLIQGTGLGLSIIKHNLELLNGTMAIESEVNVGTKVKITIPR